MLNLEDYDMSPERGFLCRHNASDVTLSDDQKNIANVSKSQPYLKTSGRERKLLRDR